MSRADDPNEQVDIYLVPGLSPEQQADALSIFAGLRATRRARDEHGDDHSQPVELCGVRIADGSACMLPLPHSAHRDPDADDGEGAQAGT